MKNDSTKKTRTEKKKRIVLVGSVFFACILFLAIISTFVFPVRQSDPAFASKPDSTSYLANFTGAVFSDFNLSRKTSTRNFKAMSLDTAHEKVRNVQHTLLGFERQDNEKILKTTIKSGDTISFLLSPWLTGLQINEIVELSKEHHPLTRLNINKPYTIVVDLNNNFKRFEYERDIDNTFVLVAELLTPTEDIENNFNYLSNKYNFTADLLPTIYTVELAYINAQINHSLFDSLITAGEGVSLANTMVDVFAYQIDFFRDLRVGDSFEILVEKKYRDGEFKSYGKMLAATFTNQGNKYIAYRFAQDGINGSYYDPQGEALERLLLRVPLSFTRISSGYSLARKHPILGITRPHMGIDYAAPKGTPVYTIGDGVVTFAGWQGGYGYMVSVRHTNGFESQYAHLSGFHSSVKKGVRVTRGSTIGYVGSTGLSTGPHLDFRLKHNGQFINPNSLSNIPKAPAITEENKEKFLNQVAIINGYLYGETSLAHYEAGKMLPDELPDPTELELDEESIETLSSLQTLRKLF